MIENLGRLIGQLFFAVGALGFWIMMLIVIYAKGKLLEGNLIDSGVIWCIGIMVFGFAIDRMAMRS